jgi:hypothetical protein
VPGSRARDLVRRSVGAVTVTVLLGAAVVVGAGLTVPGSTAPPAAGAPASVPIRTISPAPETSPAPTPSGRATAGRPGIAISARPDTDGSFLVSEIITLPAAVTEAELRPPWIADAGTGFEGLRPVAVNVDVSAGGQVLAVPDGPIRSAVTLRWDSPTSSLRLRYRLTQVSIASAPAKTGRRLAVFGSMLGQMPADLPVRVVVTGRTLLSLTCPQLPLAEMSCGAGIAPKFWTVRPIPFDRSRVQVQYDRPARRS